MDKYSSAMRSSIMAKVKSRDTKLEMLVRRLVYGLGFRYRLHRKDIPGRPDLAFIGLKKAIFVHGCFWHQHPGCKRAARPQTNPSFWDAKLNENIERDKRTLAELTGMGWKALVVWQCEMKPLEGLRERIKKFLEE